MLARSQWSIGTVIRGALVISFSVCVCVLCLFLSHTFSNFQMSQSGPPKPAPATCISSIHKSDFYALCFSKFYHFFTILYKKYLKKWQGLALVARSGTFEN